MRRFPMVAVLVVLCVSAIVAYEDPQRAALARDTVSAASAAPSSAASSAAWRQREPTTAVQVPRGANGEFAVQARINGISAAMVVDTGATSVVLTYETAKAIGLPLELLEYNVDVQTASGHTKAARLWLDRIAIGKMVERSVPALVVGPGQMKTNLLGMSFLDRLESFEVRADHLMLHGFQEPVAFRFGRRSLVLNSDAK